jgi:hypothetical protein
VEAEMPLAHGGCEDGGSTSRGGQGAASEGKGERVMGQARRVMGRAARAMRLGEEGCLAEFIEYPG